MMKRLSDYKGEAALDLWAEILEPISVILADAELKKIYTDAPKITVATYVLKNHKDAAMRVLKAIDDSEITAVNLIKRILDIITDIEHDADFRDFFKSAEQENAGNAISGSATENIGGGVN